MFVVLSAVHTAGLRWPLGFIFEKLLILPTVGQILCKFTCFLTCLLSG